jgi:hypothetical protein
MASTPIDRGGAGHSAWDRDTVPAVSSLDRYLLGSYGLMYHRDRSRVNISSAEITASVNSGRVLLYR